MVPTMDTVKSMEAKVSNLVGISPHEKDSLRNIYTRNITSNAISKKHAMISRNTTSISAFLFLFAIPAIIAVSFVATDGAKDEASDGVGVIDRA